MTIEQLDNLKMYIGAMSGALLIQQDAIEDEDVSRVWNTNRDLARQINKLKRLINQVRV